MPPNLSISQLRDFINKEKVYILMVSFILLVNAWVIFAQKIPGMKEGFLEKEVLRPDLAKHTEDKDKYSSLFLDEKIPWSEVLKKGKHLLPLLNILGLLSVFLFSLGLFLDIRILLAKVKKRKIFKMATGHLRVRWGIWDIFRLVIIFVFLGYILHIIETNFLSSGSGGRNILPVFPLLNTGIIDLALLGTIIYFVKVKYKQSVAAVGLKIKDIGKSIFLGVASYIAFLPILTLLIFLLVILAAVFNYQPPPQTLFKLFFQEKSLWLLIYSTVIVVILGPIVEEVFFRGFAYNAIKRRWGAQVAQALTAIVFAGLHANLFGFLPIMALGFLLAYVYEQTGSLVCSITVHILHNTMMVSLLFLARYFVSLAQ